MRPILQRMSPGQFLASAKESGMASDDVHRSIDWYMLMITGKLVVTLQDKNYEVTLTIDQVYNKGSTNAETPEHDSEGSAEGEHSAGAAGQA